MHASIDVKGYYELLRKLNPYLPPPEQVVGEVITKAGLNQISTVTIEVAVKLPELEEMAAKERELFPLLITKLEHPLEVADGGI